MTRGKRGVNLHLERVAVVLASVRVVKAEVVVVSLDLDVVCGKGGRRGSESEKEGCEHDERCCLYVSVRVVGAFVELVSSDTGHWGLLCICCGFICIGASHDREQTSTNVQ